MAQLAEIASQPTKENAGTRRVRDVQPRRTVNVRLLVVSFVTFAVTGGAAYWWHGNRTRNVADALILRAAQLAEQEDWASAAAYLSHALTVRPDDTDSRLRMAGHYVKAANDLRAKRRAVGVLYTTLGHVPDDLDTRRQLAELLFEIGDYKRAFEQAEELRSRLGQSTGEDYRVAARIAALSLYARVEATAEATIGGVEGDGNSKSPTTDEPLVPVATVRQKLEEALAKYPEDIQLASSVAELYVRFADELAAEGEQPLERAASALQALVEQKPDDPGAWLTRYRFRRQRDDADAIEDLERALELDPASAEGLYLRAATRLETGEPEDLEQARSDLSRVIELAPQHEQAYLLLSHVHERLGEQPDALQTLESGAKQLGHRSIPIALQQAEMYLARQQLDNAKKARAEAANLFAQQSPSWSDDHRVETDGRLRLVTAAIEISDGAAARAVPDLERVVVSLSSRTEADWAKRLLVRAHVLSADAWTRLGAPERAAEHWLRTAELDASMIQALFFAAESYKAAGLFSDSADKYQQYLQADANPPQAAQARLGLLQVQMATELLRPAAQRNWTAFLSSLDAVQQEQPNRWQPDLLEVEYLLVAEDEEGRQRAVSLIEQAAGQHSADPAFWEAAAKAYARLEMFDAAHAAVSRVKELASSGIDYAVVESRILARAGKFAEADAALAAASKAATPADRLRLQVERIRIAASQGNQAEAQSIIDELIDGGTKDPAIWSLAGELALSSGDVEGCIRAEEGLRDLTGSRGIAWRHLRAQRLLSRFAELESSERAELASFIAGLRSDRPRSAAVLSLAARFAEASGDKEAAIRLYQSAVDLGYRRLPVIERLVKLQYEAKQFVQAEENLRLAAEADADNATLDALSISVAVQQENMDEALRRAKDAASRHPEDINRALWHANLLFMNQQLVEAEQAFRDLTESHPSDVRPWNGLFTFLVRTRRNDEARTTLNSLLESIQVEPAQAAFIAGQCYEQLRDWQLARKHYERAVNGDPGQLQYRKRLARLLLATDTAAAREQYERVVERDPQDQEARRQLAALLASTGRESDWEKAFAMLDDDGSKAAQISDDRLRAVLLTRRGRTRSARRESCELARQIVTGLIETTTGPVNDADRILLAGIYEQLASLDDSWELLESARTQLRNLVDRREPSVQYLTLYVDFLLRHLNGDLIGRSEQLAAERARESFLSDARRRVVELEERTRNPQGLVPLVVFGAKLRVDQLADPEQDVAPSMRAYGEELLQACKTDAERTSVLLSVGNLATSLKLHSEAEYWYRELSKANEAGYLMLATSLAAQGKVGEATELCLKAGEDVGQQRTSALLARMFSSAGHTEEQFAAVKPIIDAAVEEHGSDAELLMAVAVMHTQRGANEEAISLFRKVVELEPDNVVARNNLATMLAEQPGGSEEALKHIDRAMAIAGRKAALLDTQGTIHLLAGQYGPAVESLEEAAAGMVEDPRIFLHLAAAYSAVGRTRDAQTLLEKALGRGIADTILTKKDQELLRDLQASLPTTTASVDSYQ